MFRLIVVLGFVAVLSACVSTGYKAVGAKGTPTGYVESKISQAKYHLKYVGTKEQKEQVFGLFLRRASELTVQENYQFFVVHEDQDANQRALSSEPAYPVFESNIEMTNKKVKGAYDAKAYLKQNVPQKMERH